MERSEIIERICNLVASLSDKLQLAAFHGFMERNKFVEYQVAPNDTKIIISTTNLTTPQLLELYKKLSIYSS
jgi:hypothetical protein